MSGGTPITPWPGPQSRRALRHRHPQHVAEAGFDRRASAGTSLGPRSSVSKARGSKSSSSAALGFLAGRRPGAKLGTTMLLPVRNLVRLAKQLATVDRLSGGNLLVTFVPGLAHGPERTVVSRDDPVFASCRLAHVRVARATMVPTVCSTPKSCCHTSGSARRAPCLRSGFDSPIS